MIYRNLWTAALAFSALAHVSAGLGDDMDRIERSAHQLRAISEDMREAVTSPSLDITTLVRSTQDNLGMIDEVLSDLTSATGRLRENVEEMDSERRGMQGEVTESWNQIDALTRIREEQEADISTARERISQLTRENETLAEEKEHIATENDEKETARRFAEIERDSLERELGIARAEADSSRTLASDVQEKFEGRREEVAEFVGRLSSMLNNAQEERLQAEMQSQETRNRILGIEQDIRNVLNGSIPVSILARWVNH